MPPVKGKSSSSTPPVPPTEKKSCDKQAISKPKRAPVDATPAPGPGDVAEQKVPSQTPDCTVPAVQVSVPAEPVQAEPPLGTAPDIGKDNASEPPQEQDPGVLNARTDKCLGTNVPLSSAEDSHASHSETAQEGHDTILELKNQFAEMARSNERLNLRLDREEARLERFVASQEEKDKRHEAVVKELQEKIARLEAKVAETPTSAKNYATAATAVQAAKVKQKPPKPIADKSFPPLEETKAPVAAQQKAEKVAKAPVQPRVKKPKTKAVNITNLINYEYKSQSRIQKEPPTGTFATVVFEINARAFAKNPASASPCRARKEAVRELLSDECGLDGKFLDVSLIGQTLVQAIVSTDNEEFFRHTLQEKKIRIKSDHDPMECPHGKTLAETEPSICSRVGYLMSRHGSAVEDALLKGFSDDLKEKIRAKAIDFTSKFKAGKQGNDNEADKHQ